ncbi:putative non-LTR retroelement reverse transcriptase [Senna tora]|uniref:Putative non-LTR retroelement reverse transcriptase n=1 Tax=Senna tora TaxID=362788 RepID=A0A834X8D7_9FABA|nr:putative non-LTR retroelement reverse transcriptase [Senna tora]
MGEETCLHALRDCSAAKSIWKKFVNPARLRDFFSLPMEVWMDRNLKKDWGMRSDNKWNIVFGVACWWLWKVRNEVVFCFDTSLGSDPYMSIHLKVREILQLEEKALVSGRKKNVYKECYVGWACPSEGWVKCNTDGASRGRGSRAGCGGVIRDGSSAWLGGFSRELRNCNALLAEIWGFVYGADLAWRLGFRRVCFELDSKDAVNMILKGCDVRHPCAFAVKMARELIDRCCQVEVFHVFRECNEVANWLAAFAVNSGSKDWDGDPPFDCRSLVLRDAVGFGVPRLVAVSCAVLPLRSSHAPPPPSPSAATLITRPNLSFTLLPSPRFFLSENHKQYSIF